MPDSHAVPMIDRPRPGGPPPRGVRRFLSEPLVHFLAIGAVLFGISAARAPAGDPARVIEVTPAVRAEITELYAGVNHRPPTEAELAPLLENWVRTQVLYREALALGLDKGDDMIRERITHKMNLLVFSNLRVPPPTEAELQDFFAANRARYDRPARYDFLGLLPGSGTTQEQAEAIAHSLGDEDAAPPAELVARVRAYAGRDRAGIAALFGPAFADTLVAMAPDTWRALPIDPAAGSDWLVARLARVRPAEPAAFDAVRSDVAEAWQTETTRLLARQAIAEMGRRYTIIGGPAP